MKKQLAATFLLIAFPIFLVSCVSSILKESPPTFSSDVKWNNLPASFEKMDTGIYPAWKNPRTGNVISIVSDCGNSSGAGLLGLHQLVESSVEEFQLVKEQKLLYKNKSALVHHSEGEVDGSPIEIQSMSFRRKDCGYLTSLSGKKNNLESDRKAFEQFNYGLTFP
ncbi:MAG: hypothetical protein H7328_08660 [Bdellovibrio sp.]|nr:hypothetical protein [Bdellovibrio sp.]